MGACTHARTHGSHSPVHGLHSHARACAQRAPLRLLLRTRAHSRQCARELHHQCPLSAAGYSRTPTPSVPPPLRSCSAQSSPHGHLQLAHRQRQRPRAPMDLRTAALMTVSPSVVAQANARNAARPRALSCQCRRRRRASVRAHAATSAASGRLAVGLQARASPRPQVRLRRLQPADSGPVSPGALWMGCPPSSLGRPQMRRLAGRGPASRAAAGAAAPARSLRPPWHWHSVALRLGALRA